MDVQSFYDKVQGLYFDFDRLHTHRRALLVGFKQYANKNLYATTLPDTPTCVHSVQRLEKRLNRWFQTRLIDDDARRLPHRHAHRKPNRERIDAELDWLFADSTAQDTLIFYYTGHGSMAVATRADGTTQEETHLVLPHRSVPEEKGHHDHYRVTEIIERARKAQFKAFIMILDCCFSGNIGDGPNGTFDNLPKGVCILTAGKQGESVPAAGKLILRGRRQTDWEIREAQREARDYEEDGSYWAAGRNGEASQYHYTYFSGLLIEALCGGGANPFGIVTLSSAYQYISEGMGTDYAQTPARPMMKSNLEKDIPLTFDKGIITPLTLQHLWEFRRQHFKPNQDDCDGATFPTDKQHRQSLNRLLKLGLVLPMGHTVQPGKWNSERIPLFRITPRGWHFCEMYERLTKNVEK